MANVVQSRKKLVQPIRSTMTPVKAFAKILGTDANAEKSAN